jgi:hypothetical protein
MTTHLQRCLRDRIAYPCVLITIILIIVNLILNKMYTCVLNIVTCMLWTNTTEEGRCVAKDSHATIEGTVFFFVVRSGDDVMQQWRILRRCFLWGPAPGYV